MTHESDPFGSIELDKSYSFDALRQRITDGFAQLDSLAQVDSESLEYVPERVYVVSLVVPMGAMTRFRFAQADTGMVIASVYDINDDVPIRHFVNIAQESARTSEDQSDITLRDVHTSHDDRVIVPLPMPDQRDEMLSVATMMELVLDELRERRAEIKAFCQ